MDISTPSDKYNMCFLSSLTLLPCLCIPFITVHGVHLHLDQAQRYVVLPFSLFFFSLFCFRRCTLCPISCDSSDAYFIVRSLKEEGWVPHTLPWWHPCKYHPNNREYQLANTKVGRQLTDQKGCDRKPGLTLYWTSCDVVRYDFVLFWVQRCLSKVVLPLAYSLASAPRHGQSYCHSHLVYSINRLPKQWK